MTLTEKDSNLVDVHIVDIIDVDLDADVDDELDINFLLSFMLILMLKFLKLYFSSLKIVLELPSRVVVIILCLKSKCDFLWQTAFVAT